MNAISRLTSFINNAKEQDIYYTVAYTILENQLAIGKISINDLAERCHVSPSTISRFCRMFGYDNFHQFKKNFEASLNVEQVIFDISPKEIMQMMDDPKKDLTEYNLRVAKIMQHTVDNLDFDEIDIILKKIHDAQKVAFFGIMFPQYAASLMQMNLMYLNKITMAYNDTQEQLKCAENLDEDSVAVVFTNEGNISLISPAMTRAIYKSGATLVVITQNPDTKLSLKADHIITVGEAKGYDVGRFIMVQIVEILSKRYYCLFYNPYEEK
ncbi:MurR/RpiR family transcriptional regulator [Culicoidibacter larvae]|uniref:MurR/RpiR family transcriptional regulator n=1 Tax=Culicoidibacter larvae TaxID=2579976 RepID=A0A5R8QDI0_9FIRM|nr:MurR/RpiR family transcriptional regulator [Culicoidibacter larvae]TLG73817.1 MurR/RpiR family transcriptional regulator [Culicoidibacter larvae]